MLIAQGQIDNQDTPLLEIEVWGTDAGLKKKFKAVLDTGFNGFLSIPECECTALGIVFPGDTTQVVYASGDVTPNKIAEGHIGVSNLVRPGLFIAEEDSPELLLGMEFIKKFDFTLYMSDNKFYLMDKEAIEEVDKALKKIVGA